MNVTITARALNVGMAMRTLTTTPVSGMTPGTASATINAAAPTGSATLTLPGSLSTASCVYVLGSCTASVSNATITVPIGVFADASFINPASTDAWYWFIANNWHQVTYYAASPAHLPGGGRNCSTSSNCITIKVAGGSDLTGRKAVLILAGRSVNGVARPTATLIDYLEANALNPNYSNSNLSRTAFLQDRIGKRFNDRVVTVSSY